MVHPQASRPRTTFEPMQDRVAKGVHGRHAGHNENAYSFSLDELVKPRIKLTGQTYKLSNAKHNLIMAAELHASMELRAASRALLSTLHRQALVLCLPRELLPPPHSCPHRDDKDDDVSSRIWKAFASMGIRGRGRGGSARGDI